jgi:serine/threonine protein kinase
MDLAARNVLVAEGFVCKIADFGMAKDTNYYVASSNRLVPIRWAAPEVLRQRVFSTASDVWSFGILLWELATNAASLPYASMGNSAAIMSVLSGYRLEKPSGCPGAVYRVCTALRIPFAVDPVGAEGRLSPLPLSGPRLPTFASTCSFRCPSTASVSVAPP